MQDISKFFSKFNNIAVKEIRKRELICEIFFKVIKQKIDIKDISIKNGILNIKCDQIMKSEIYMKKSQLLEKINGKIGEKIVDIK